MIERCSGTDVKKKGKSKERVGRREEEVEEEEEEEGIKEEGFAKSEGVNAGDVVDSIFVFLNELFIIELLSETTILLKKYEIPQKIE
jgi:hypothetical protein